MIEETYDSIRISTVAGARLRITHVGQGALNVFMGAPFGSAQSVSLLPDEAEALMCWLYSALSDSR